MGKKSGQIKNESRVDAVSNQNANPHNRADQTPLDEIAALREEIAFTRSETSRTLDEIQNRLSPAHLQKEAQEIFSVTVKEKAHAIFFEQKERARLTLDTAVEALRQTAENLLLKDEVAAAGLAEKAADQAVRVSKYIEEQEIEDVIRDTRKLAGAHPWSILGGAFLAGIMVARFIRSSSVKTDRQASCSYASAASSTGDQYYTRTADLSVEANVTAASTPH